MGELPILIFDLGGVLCEFSPSRRLAALGEASELAPDEVRQLLEDCRLIHLADRGHLDQDGEYRLATSVLGLDCDYPTYRSLWCSALEPNDDVIAIARNLHGSHRMAILTNNGPVLLDALSHDLQVIGKEFDDLFVSAMFGAIKPAEDAFRGVERSLGVRPEQLILIDDSQANVAGAEHRGWRGIRFTSAPELVTDLRVALAGSA
jgi:putative hydrolase of the HAD superfamily